MRAKTTPRSKPGRAAARAAVTDRKLATAALFLIVAAAATVVYLVSPTGMHNQSYQIVLLCLFLAVAAARSLIGYCPSQPSPPPPLWLLRLALPAVFLAALLPYLPSLFAGFLSDDFALTAAVARLEGPVQALTSRAFLPVFYRPLHIFLWWLQYRLWGDAPLGYHAVSLLFHATNALLVYALGRRLTGSLLAGLIAGLLFALHPTHVEAVAWASCQPDLQAALFSLLALLLLDISLHPSRPRITHISFLAGLLAFALAVLTKESAVVLPGLAALWTLVRSDRLRWRRATLVGASYGLLLGAYLALRFTLLGGLGGYHTLVGFWNVFPSAPLRQMSTFLFPLNRALIGHVVGLVLPLVLLMAGFLFWCARDLRSLPGRRLGLYLGFLFLAAVPVWLLPWPNADLEGTRWGYLPTVGLIWLIGDSCAGRGLAWRRAGRVTAALLVASAALTVWYLTPWLRAQRLAQQVITAGARMVAEAPPSIAEPVFYVESLPDTHSGAQVFRNGYAQALDQKLGRNVLLHTVSRSGGVAPEVIGLLTLQPGEYRYAWDAKTKRMTPVPHSPGRPANREPAP